MSLPIKSRNLGRYGLVNFTRALGQGGYFILAIMKYRYRSETQLCFALANHQTNKQTWTTPTEPEFAQLTIPAEPSHYFPRFGPWVKNLFVTKLYVFPRLLGLCYVPVVQLLPRQMCDEHTNVQRYTCKKIGGQSLPRITIIIVLSGYVHLLEFILGLQRCIESTWS